MICKTCGEYIADDAHFCENCGASAEPAPDTANTAEQENTPLTTGQSLGILVLFCIPLVNLVLMLIWAYAPRVNENRRSLARAGLILTGILIGIAIITLSVLIIGILMGWFTVHMVF